MFLRHYERRKSGTQHTYRALVESYRTARGSRQRVHAYLGGLAQSEQERQAKLGAHSQSDDAARQPERMLGLASPLAKLLPACREDVGARWPRSSGLPGSTNRRDRMEKRHSSWRESRVRRSKEPAVHEKFAGHMKACLKKLVIAVELGRLRDETPASERLGRLEERFWRASRAFDVTIRKMPKPIRKHDLERQPVGDRHHPLGRHNDHDSRRSHSSQHGGDAGAFGYATMTDNGGGLGQTITARAGNGGVTAPGFGRGAGGGVTAAVGSTGSQTLGGNGDRATVGTHGTP